MLNISSRLLYNVVGEASAVDFGTLGWNPKQVGVVTAKIANRNIKESVDIFMIGCDCCYCWCCKIAINRFKLAIKIRMTNKSGTGYCFVTAVFVNDVMVATDEKSYFNKA